VSTIVPSPDFITITTNVGVFLAALGTVVAAIWSAFKKIKAIAPDNAHKVLAGSIMEHHTLVAWSESNRAVVDAFRDHQKELMELRFAILRLTDRM